MRLFYTSPYPDSVSITIQDTLTMHAPLQVSDSLSQTRIFCDGAKSVALHFNPIDSLKIYGVSFESGPGVYVDNFAMRGNSGLGLFQVEKKQVERFNRFQNYNLIILQYGLNVVTEDDSTGYHWYTEKMIRVVSRLRQMLPRCSFLMIGISDRSFLKNGKFVTMPNILLMRDAQREVAQRSKIAFWDLFEAMGGENSMPKYVNATPALASKDYTHLNYRGGHKLAKKLTDAILFDREKHVSKNDRNP
jgi:lysophospholipase L1-like esterase